MPQINKIFEYCRNKMQLYIIIMQNTVSQYTIIMIVKYTSQVKKVLNYKQINHISLNSNN